MASPEPLHYRNKLIFNVKFAHPRVIAGLFERHSHRTVDIDACPLQTGPINRAVPQVKKAIVDRRWPVYNESKRTGSLRSFSLRSGTDGRLLLTLVVKQQNLSGLEEQAAAWLREIEGLAGVLLNVHAENTNTVFSHETILVNGSPAVTSRVCGIDFQVEPTTFFQVNPAQTEHMITAISRGMGRCDRLVDAYCGTGLPGLPLARDVSELVGIDIDPRAVAAAAACAERNRIPHARFIQGDVEEALPRILEETPHHRSSALLIDPPRKGLSEPMRRSLAASPVQQIVYVSCNPGTLSRDLVELCKGGFRIEKLHPLDMFPQTCHVECIAFLSR
jgi:23S rRNA (uracil1939-C5)-methyltransferase